MNLSVWRGCFFKHCQSIYPTGLAGMSILAHRTHILKSVALARLCFLIEHCEITHPTGFAGMLILTHRTHMLKAIALGRLHSWRQRSGSTPITGLAGNRSWYMKHTYQTISQIGECSSFYFGNLEKLGKYPLYIHRIRLTQQYVHSLWDTAKKLFL